MLAPVFLLLFPTAGIDFEQLDALAKNRSETELAALCSPELAAKAPFKFLTTGGVYGTGSRGWNALPLRSPLDSPAAAPKYVVFSTWIQSECLGEQVFELKDGKIQRKIEEMETYGIEAKRHNLDLTITPGTKSIEFKDKLEVIVTPHASPVGFLRLPTNCKVTHFDISGQKESKFEQAGGTIVFERPKVNSGAKPLTLEIHYSGKFDFRVTHGLVADKEAMLAGAMWWPSIARQASTSKITMTAPKAWYSISHGKLIQDQTEGEQRTMTYQNDLPISVFSASSGEYKRFETTISGRKYWIASMNMSQEVMEDQCNLFHPTIDFYNKLVQWPYDQYGAVVSPLFRGGALEAYSYATYLEGWLPATEPHEPAHTLFGGVIPNTYYYSLWNESFADFFERYYMREGAVGNREDLRLIFGGTMTGMPIHKRMIAETAGVYSGSGGGEIGYARGGRVLEQLENWVGPDQMTDYIKTWLKNHPRGKTAEWSDFEKIVTKDKPELKTFFDQWNRRAGYAEFDVEFKEPTPSLSAWNVGKLKFSGEPYAMPLEVMVETTAGTELVSIMLTGQKEVDLIIPCKGRPSAVSVDPYLKIFRNRDGSELPPDLAVSLRTRQVWAEEGFADQARKLSRGVRLAASWPENLNGYLLVGDPYRSVRLVELLKRLPDPPVVTSNTIQWRGQEVNVDKGMFCAIVPLEDGGKCVVALGKTKYVESFGRSDAVLMDGYGRVLAGTRSPKKTGRLTYQFGPGP